MSLTPYKLEIFRRVEKVEWADHIVWATTPEEAAKLAQEVADKANESCVFDLPFSYDPNDEGEFSDWMVQAVDTIKPADHDELDYIDQTINEPLHMVRFIGQAWINDHAIPVDDKTVCYKVTQRELDDAQKSDVLDELQTAAGAPDWVKDWSGPFEVELVDD